jgi:putative FmdB family regulatory protein
MVTRLYYCKACEHQFETVQPMNEELKTKCPKCKKKKLIQDLSGSFHGSVMQYNTVGSLAEKNTRELGIYGRQAKEKEVLDKEESIKQNRENKLREMGLNPVQRKKTTNSLPPKKVLLDINNGNIEAIKKYIYEGK